MEIIDKLIMLFKDEQILPINQDNWRVFKLTHCLPKDEYIRKEQYTYIKQNVGKRAGIYIYYKDDKCLYIGKAKLLFDRIKSHYIESFEPVPGDTKDMRWHRFFAGNQGDVLVYWKEFESEEERQIVELLLTKILKPFFLNFK